jgi:dienelactone hydrolase
LLAGVLAVLSPPQTAANEAVLVPFVQYPANQRFLPHGREHGWAVRFQDGSPQEQGRIAEHGHLRGEMFLPDGPGPFPVVILMHGCGGMDAIARQWATSWSRFLNSMKFGALILDSFTTRNVKASCGEGDAPWSRRRVDDAYSALDFLSNLPTVRRNEIYVMGRSNGGRTALNAVHDLYRPMRINLFAGAISLYPSCIARKNDNFYAKLLIFVAGLDDANPPQHCRDLRAKPRPSDHPELSVVEYDGVYHGYDDGSPFRRFNGWRLGGDPAAAADTQRRVKRFLTKAPPG